MAWEEEMLIIVRGVIQDYDEPATYTDEQLKKIILVSAMMVQADAVFSERYDINVVDQTITPDFTDRTSGHRNEAYINLIALKAGCMIVTGEIKKYTGQGISIRDGTSAVSLQRSPASLTLMNKTFCEVYTEALYNYKLNGADGQGTGLGEAIVGPFKYFYTGDCSPISLIDGGSTYGGSAGRDSRGCF